MATQTQTAFSIIKAGIDKALGSGVYKSMEEMLDLIQAYNTLVEANTELHSDINEQHKRIELLQEKLKILTDAAPELTEENHN